MCVYIYIYIYIQRERERETYALRRAVLVYKESQCWDQSSIPQDAIM